ncbi:MAG TPA: NifB/NifX family molybdenum-iron cluster-binding protein, partial [Syntrophorhabdaceae bacterium]|nr:NifB/NifX family molybdenum-iron cluster-binding protein [Syntrophorhabdaceae bacterium]
KPNLKMADFCLDNGGRFIVSLLKSLKIKIVICGGIKEEHFFLFKDNKIKVITNVIGDVEDIVRQIDSEFLKMI